MDAKITKLTSFLSVALATLMCATGAHAQQNSFQGRFTLPFEVHWRSTVLPAGEYSIAIPALNQPAVVWSADRNTEVFIPVGQIGEMEMKSSYLTLVRLDGMWKVMSMNLPGLYLSLIYTPANETERKTQVTALLQLR